MAPSNVAAFCRQRVPKELNVKEEHAEKSVVFSLQFHAAVCTSCLEGITYAVINLKCRSELQYMRTSWHFNVDVRQHCAQCCVPAACLLAFKHLFLLRDEAVKKLNRKALFQKRYLNLVLELLLMVCIHRPATPEIFTLTNVPWSSHLLCTKCEGENIWSCL